MTEEKKLKITFAPGCFDGFEGTQEELDEMIGEITKIFNEHTPEEIMAMSRPLSDIVDEIDEADLQDVLQNIDSDKTERKLH